MSLKSIAVASIIAAAAAGAAHAGDAQLAARLGVDAAQFTTAQLIQLEAYKSEGNQEGVRFVLSQAGSGVSKSGSDVGNAGGDQLAAILGLEAGRYTTAELIAIDNARSEGDLEAEAFYLSGTNRANGDSNGAGKVQLAASLGVSASDYTLNELATMAGRLSK